MRCAQAPAVITPRAPVLFPADPMFQMAANDARRAYLAGALDVEEFEAKLDRLIADLAARA